VKYAIDYQFQPKGSKEVVDIGGVEDIEIDDTGFGLVPVSGDLVDIPGDRAGDRQSFRGRVCRRAFHYVLGYCHVQVVLAEIDDAEWDSISA
jgi:hypothetical protein